MIKRIMVNLDVVEAPKKLNLQSLVEKVNVAKSSNYVREIEVIFLPFHFEEYIINDNKLIINFFAVEPNDIKERICIGKKQLLWYIETKANRIN
jgi:hypothetical protein